MSIVGATFQGQQQFAGRSYYATKSIANTGNLVIDPLRLAAKDQWLFNHYEPESKVEHEHSDEEPEAEEEEEVNEDGTEVKPKKQPAVSVTPLLVKSFCLNVGENTEKHRTNQYNISNTSCNAELSPCAQNGKSQAEPELVVRRGDTFTINIDFNQPYDKDTHELYIQLQIGNEPIASKNTYVTLNVKEGLKLRRWSAGVVSSDDTKVVVEVRLPGDTIVGKWQVHVDTTPVLAPVTEVNDLDAPLPPRTIHRYTHPRLVYIIFNPWSPEDEVHMDESELLSEYVLAETGRIFMGNSRHTIARPWSYGQFEDFVLDCSLQLLDAASLKLTMRNNPVLVAKALCSIICCPSAGVLASSWSGNYEGSVSPGAWTGSVPILSHYIKQQETVKYGQCWTVAGVFTTVCRALGIPCRTVTSYSSAHDSDGTATVDVHWNNKGQPVEEWNRDATWSFHVWNEVWMARSDLPCEYGGWQAVDATPRETSQGQHVFGPVSVKAIREGDVFLPYGAAAFFASVNSDIRHWVHRDDLSWIQKTKKHGTGVLLVTKKSGVNDRPRVVSALHDKWEESLTQAYKHKSDTEQERKAIQKANLPCTCPKITDKELKEDVGFEFMLKDNLMVGRNFDVTVQLQNKSRLKRTVHVTLTCSSVHYTGVFKAKVRTDEQLVELSCIKASQANMRINMEDYLHLVSDQLCFRFSCQAEVVETGQIFAEYADYRLDRPKINIVVPEKVLVGKPFQCHIQMQNPTSAFLTKTAWYIESPGIQEPMEIPFGRDVDPYETVTHKLMLTASKSGSREIIVTFDSKELRDVSGVQEICVEE